MSMQRGRYRRRSRKGIQAPRTQATTNCEHWGRVLWVGTYDAYGRGYRPRTQAGAGEKLNDLVDRPTGRAALGTALQSITICCSAANTDLFVEQIMHCAMHTSVHSPRMLCDRHSR